MQTGPIDLTEKHNAMSCSLLTCSAHIHFGDRVELTLFCRICILFRYLTTQDLP